MNHSNQERWTKIREHLTNASRLIPVANSQDEDAGDDLEDFHEYLNNNELELAWDELYDANDLANSKDIYWREMAAAAKLMESANRSDIAKNEAEANLLEKTKDILCAPRLEIICKCAGFGNCDGCKIAKLAREWVTAFGKRPCKHTETWVATEPGHLLHPLLKCVNCKEIVNRG